MSLQELLTYAQAQDGDTRQNAQNMLEQQKQANPAGFLEDLSSVIGSNSPSLVRQLAAILFKNCLKNISQEECLVNVWDSVAAERKTSIRTQVMSALAAEDLAVRRSAAQAVAAIAALDFVRNEWLELVEVLGVNAANVNQNFRVSSLMTLAFICEDLPAGAMQTEHVNRVLNVVAAGVEDPDFTVKKVSLRALRAALGFAVQNFSVETERTYLIRIVGESCLATEEEIRVEGFLVLCEIVTRFYDYLASYLNDLGQLTFRIIESDCERVAVLAVEVWSLIADAELDRIECLQPDKPVRGYVSTAARHLVSLLIKNVTRAQDLEGWNLTKACGAALSTIIQITKDVHVETCIGFVSSSLETVPHSACVVFGSILEGPSSGKLAPLITSKLGVLLNCLQVQDEATREAAAWVVSRICELHYRVVSSPQYFNLLVPSLCRLLMADLPSIACHSCWALINLIEHSVDIKLFKLDQYNEVVKVLYQASQRQDQTLQVAAYSAIATLMEKCTEDCVPAIVGSTQEFLQLLSQANNESTQGALCSVLKACFMRAESGHISDELAAAFLDTLNLKVQPSEEAISAVSALASCLGPRFQLFLPKITQQLNYALAKTEAVSLCRAGLMLLGEIATCLGKDSSKTIQDLVGPLINILSQPDVSGLLKMQSIESLADIASNTKEAFTPYIPQILPIIESACLMTLEVPEHNYDLLEYLKNLREAIVQFYEGFIFGQLSGGNLQGLFHSVPQILDYVLKITQDKFIPSVNIHLSAIGIIGDLATHYQTAIKGQLQVPEVHRYLSLYKTNSNMKIKQLANWAYNTVNSL